MTAFGRVLESLKLFDLPKVFPCEVVLMSDHTTLRLDVSPHAAIAGYNRPSASERAIASGIHKAEVKELCKPDAQEKLSRSFPAPLVLPGDDLAEDPEYPPQTVREWQSEGPRNAVTKSRRTIYVAAPPTIARDAALIPQVPRAQDVADYLAAFYHGMAVKVLPKKLSFCKWENEHDIEPNYIGLNIGTKLVGIRTLASYDGMYGRQLNSDDMLDAAASLLPKDAYALMLLTEHDLYESDDDDFLCGRAYGASRIAVVSSSRYNPAVDDIDNVDRDHPWPASHFRANVANICAKGKKSSKKRKRININPVDESPNVRADEQPFPLLDAVQAHKVWVSEHPTATAATLSSMWLARVCRTASHELGHCFGIDHCVYYACAMQGTASLAEDTRQPPYLCPIDAVKIARATGSDVQQQYKALLSFCERREDCQMFSTFAAWLRARLAMQG